VKIEIVGIEIFDRLSVRAFDLCFAHRRFDGADHACCDSVLQIKDIVQATVVPISPQMEEPLESRAGAATVCSPLRRTVPAFDPEPTFAEGWSATSTDFVLLVWFT